MVSQQVEEYLEAVGKLEERGEAITTTALARERGVSLPSATEMLQRLSDQGMIVYEQRKQAHLTPQGRRVAATVVRRHRLWERFLHDILGLGWDRVHDEACRLEHATSPDVESRLADVLGNAATCPHGNAIPEALDDLVPAALGTLDGVATGTYARIVSVREEPSLLREMERLGVLPGATVRVVDATDVELTLGIAGRTIRLDRRSARQVVAVPFTGTPSDWLEQEDAPLTELRADEWASVSGIRGGRGFVGRLLALGFTPGVRVRMVQNSGGGPLIAVVRDTRVALGRGEAHKVRVVRET